MTNPSEEEFIAWRDHPVTRWVMRACELAADENKQQWVEKAWETGVSDPALLLENRTRADAYRALHETEYEGWKATHDAYRK